MAWYEPRATPPTPPPRRPRREDVWNDGQGLVPEDDYYDDDVYDDEYDCPGAMQRRIEHLLSAAAAAPSVGAGARDSRRPPSPRPAYRHRHPPVVVVDVAPARGRRGRGGGRPSAAAGGGGDGNADAGGRGSHHFPDGFLSPVDPAAAPPSSSHGRLGVNDDPRDRHQLDQHVAGDGRGFPGGGGGHGRHDGDHEYPEDARDGGEYIDATDARGGGETGGPQHRSTARQPSFASFAASSSQAQQHHHHRHSGPHHPEKEHEEGTHDDHRGGGGGEGAMDDHHHDDHRHPNFYRAHFQNELPPSQPRRNYTQLTLHQGEDGGLTSSSAAAASSQWQRDLSRQEWDAVGRIGPAAPTTSLSAFGATSQRGDDVPRADRHDDGGDAAAADEGEIEGGYRKKRRRKESRKKKKRSKKDRGGASGKRTTQQLLSFKENNGAEADDSDDSDVWEGGGGRRRSKKARKGGNRGGNGPSDDGDEKSERVERPVLGGNNGQRRVRSKKRRRFDLDDNPDQQRPPLVLTEESFAGLEDPNVGILNAGGSVEALREFKRLCDEQPYVAWTVVYLDRDFTTPFLPSTRRYCTDKGPPCVDWNCTCDSQVRGSSRSHAPLVGAMFVFPRTGSGGSSSRSRGGGDAPGFDAGDGGDPPGKGERHTCFVLPLGRTTDLEGSPECLPDDGRHGGGGVGGGAYGRMAVWPLIPFNCDAPIDRRWEAFRSILTRGGRSAGRGGPKCVTYNAIPSLLPVHHHRSLCPSASGDGTKAMMDLILPSVWDLKLAAWVLRPHASGEELEFDSVVAGFPHLRPPSTPVPVCASEQLRGLIRCRDDLAFLAEVYPAVSRAVSGKGLDDALDQIEGPLQGVLAAMECHGIGILPNRLSNIQRRLERRCDELTVEARAIASDDTFLLSSPQQVAHLLFDVLRITVPPGSSSQVSAGSQQQASNRSTSEAVLEAIQQQPSPPNSPQSRIVQILLEFRSLNKLLTTYIRPLPNLARGVNSYSFSVTSTSAKNGADASASGGGAIMRIHPMWMQTSVRTGRLSCRRPNMQQIPKGGAFGVVPRDAFCASSGELCLFACDYSQNEVRILAHVSGDRELIAMFGNENSVDIYRQMSAAITGKAAQDVSDGERAIAKQVVLAILYGMGIPQVAKKLKVDRNTAQRFFTSFFDRFRQVRNWIERTKDEARRNGYVTTIVGRRRYLDEIHSGDNSKRAQAERQAVNSVIQGSAADLMKLAMLKIASRIVDWHKEGVSAGGTGIAPRMILQIHDELLFEVMADSADVGRLKEAVVRCCAVECERDLKLKVPLKLTCSVGKSWGKAMKDLP